MPENSRKIRKLGKVVAWLLIGLLGLFTALLVLVQLPLVKDIIRSRIVSIVNEEIPGTIEIGRLEGNLLTSVRLRDVALFDGRDQLAARIDTVQARYDLLSLLNRQFQIESVEVDAPLVIARVYEDNVLNFETLAPEPEEDTPPTDFEVFVDRIEINNGVLAFVDQSAPTADESQRKARTQFVNALDDTQLAQLPIDELADRLTQIVTASAQARTDEVPVPPVFGTSTSLNVLARLALLEQQRVQFNAPELTTTLALDSIDPTFPLHSESLELFFSPERLDLNHQRFSLGHDTGFGPIRAMVDFTTEVDALGNRSPDGVNQLFAEIRSIDIAHSLITELLPTLDLQTGISADIEAAGIQQDIAFHGQLRPTRAPGEFMLSGELELPLELDNLAEDIIYRIVAHATDIQPHTYYPLDGVEAVISDVRAYIDGRGFDPDSMRARARLNMDAISIEEYTINTVYGDIFYDAGLIRAEPMAVLTPYLNAFASGTFDPSGTFHIELRTQGAPDEAVGARYTLPIQTQQADIHVDIAGVFDPTISQYPEALQAAQISAQWDLARFRAEDISIGSLQGELEAGILRQVQNGQAIYLADLQTRARGRGIDTPGASISEFSLRSLGSTTLQASLEPKLDTVRRLAADVEFTAQTLETPDIRTRGLQTRMQLFKRHAGDTPLEFSLDATSHGIRSPEVRISNVEASLTGALLPDLDATGLDALRYFTLSGATQITDIGAEGAHIRRFEATADLEGQPVDLQGTIRAAAFDALLANELINSANVNLLLEDARRFAVTLDVQRPEPPVENVSARLAGQYHEDLSGIDLSSIEFSIPPMNWTMREGGRVTLRPELFQFDAVHLESEDQFVAVHGTFTPSVRQDLELQMQLDFETLHEALLAHIISPISGKLEASSTLQGTSRRPVIGATLEIADFQYEDAGPFSAGFRMTYDDELLQVADAQASALGYQLFVLDASIPMRLNLEGDTQLFWDRQVMLSARVLPFTFADFYDIAPFMEENNMEGFLDASLQIGGTLEDPHLDARIWLSGIQFQGPIGDDYLEINDLSALTELRYRPPVNQRDGIMLTQHIDYDGERIFSLSASSPLPIARWIHDTIEQGRDFRIHEQSELMRTPFALRADIPGIDLRTIPLESLREVDASGFIYLDMDLHGTLNDPAGFLRADLRSLGWQQFRDIYVDIDATLLDHRIELEQMRLEWDADEILVARGELPLPMAHIVEGDVTLESFPINFAAQLQEIPIAKLSAIDYTFAQIHGSIAGYLKANGTLHAPEISSRFGLFNTELGDGRLGTLAVAMEGSDNEISAQASLCREFETLLSANAQLPINLDIISLMSGESPLFDGEIDVKVQGEDLNLAHIVPVKLIRQYITDPQGILNIDLNVGGTWDNIVPEGTINLENGAVTLPQFARRFEDIELYATLDSDEIVIGQLALGDGTGRTEMQGRIAHTQLRPTRLGFTMQTQNFNVGGFATDFPVFISSDVNITGDLTTSPNAIDVIVSGLEVTLTDVQARDLHPTELHDDIFILGANARQLGRDPMDATELTALRTLDNGALNMRVSILIERNSWLRHPLGDINFQADLTADLLNGTTAVTGQLEALRGQVEFLGRRFNVEESMIIFTGAIPPNPRLQLEATYTLDRAVVAALGPPTGAEPQITIRVLGTAQSPTLSLSSDPGMTDTEILFVLMTGRPPDRADIGQDEGVASRALSAVSGLFFGMLQDQLAGSIPVDVLRLEAGERGFRGGRLEVGKYITNDVFVALRYQFGADELEPTYIYRLEYHFLPRWMLEVLYSDLNQGEFNVYWDVY